MTDTFTALPPEAHLPAADTDPEFDQIFDDIEGNEPDTEQEAAKPGRRRSNASRAKVTARTVRSIRAKAEELTAASDTDIQLLGIALGVKPDIDDIVAYLISTPRITLAGIDEVVDIAAAGDPFAAMTKAMQYESSAKTIWAILSLLGVVAGQKPAKETESAVEIAKAAAGITKSERDALERVRELTRKGA